MNTESIRYSLPKESLDEIFERCFNKKLCDFEQLFEIKNRPRQKDSCARFIRFYYVGDEQPRADGMQYQSGDVRWRYVYRSDDYYQFCA